MYIIKTPLSKMECATTGFNSRNLFGNENSEAYPTNEHLKLKCGDTLDETVNLYGGIKFHNPFQ
jgi:hypothetical protein